ncbi:uncharacterized protein [Argopecten irradians]|uniref:uncharacterized protein n=1 Tax=Argopecten irradians TaxID=31199 RepID=UPI003722A370
MDTFYGSPERVEHALKQKLQNLPIITHKDNVKLYELVDTLNEVLAVMQDPKYGRLLGYLNSSVGIKPILLKVPIGIRNKWRERAMRYKRDTQEMFPPFSFFCSFMQEMAETFNDPGFEFGGDTDPHTTIRRTKQQITVNKTSVGIDSSATETHNRRCPIHNAGHSLSDCRAFKAKDISERLQLLRENGRCFRCCESKHRRQNCKETVKCELCDSKHHCTAMHDANHQRQQRSDDNGGELNKPHVDAKCTEICGKTFSGKSCAKIVQVKVRHKKSTHSPVRVYAILDEQSNKSLARKELFDVFDCNSDHESYCLSTCGGRITTSGRISLGFVVESIDETVSLDLPSLIECDAIPNNRQEIPTPDVAIHYPHLSNIASLISPIDNNSEILLLIGRDMLSVHHVLEQRVGQPDQPYAQRLPLGWVIVGESCLDGVHATSTANVLKTMLRPSSGSTSNLNQCESKIRVSECLIDELNIFRRTDQDNKPGMSFQDKQFLSIMDKGMKKDSSGIWIAPLPLKSNRPRLPNNRKQALDRAKTLDHSLRKDPIKRTHFLTFMQSLLDSGHAEIAPELKETDECWYLPLFGVYHPQKKDCIRGVFDSSAKVQGISLNSVLLSGPDLMNSLLGVLLRFRREAVAITADIQQMFYCFLVQKEQRSYLRFIWHQDNDLAKPLVDYHMNVHVFGNSPSPAVATYGLRKTADEAEHKYGSDVRQFVHRNFYVDDALSSHPTSEEAVDLLHRTRSALQEYGHLRLHKVSSNSSAVLSEFDSEDLAKSLKDLELGKEGLPTQRSLGICWNLQEDKFTFQVSLQDKPFTRRGVLSTINSIFDPLGFTSPVTIAGKEILREAMNNGIDWDTPLPLEHLERWERWKASLEHLGNISITRTYGGASLSQATRKDLCIFSDASETAIAAVVYLQLTDSEGNQKLGFVMGKAKLAPKHGHTIPRLELCAAVLAVELYDIVRSELDTTFDSVRFFTDSKVVLGYIRNESKRFFLLMSRIVLNEYGDVVIQAIGTMFLQK